MPVWPTLPCSVSRWIRPLPIVLVLGLLAGGCAPSLLQAPEASPTRTYVLEWAGDPAPPGVQPTGPYLLVSPVLASPGYDGSDMAYMRHPHELEYFAHHRWVDAPARMLDPLLVRAATYSGLFRGVSEAGTGAGAELRLDSRLLRLVQVCRLQPSELQLEMRVSLVDVATARVLGSRVLSIAEPIGERAPAAGVEAANRAVARLLGELQSFLAGQVGAMRR